MPRITPRLIQKAARHSLLLPLLLPACRTLESAQQELQWIKTELPSQRWVQACQQRSRFVPLQYILGSQPFGSIDVKCSAGVLIPRWETEEWCVSLIDCLREVKQKEKIQVLDICTGTGCIPLLIAKEMKEKVDVTAIDVSLTAFALSLENKRHNKIENVRFLNGDLFEFDTSGFEEVDLITSNPPYIPLEDYKSAEMGRSVRLYEPELALVGDLLFYEALIKRFAIPLKANGFIFELGEKRQSDYTRSLLDETEWESWLYCDGAGKARCVVGYRRGSNMAVLERLRH